MAANGGVAPGAATGAGDALRVQLPRDRLGRLAGCKLSEDTFDNVRFRRVDLPLAMDGLAALVHAAHDFVAVADAPGGTARLNPAAQAATGLGREILEEDGIHRALEADMEFADLAFGEGDERDTSKIQTLVETGVCPATLRY